VSAAILSIGTELTRGELVNTNASWLSGELTSLGLDVTEQHTIDDDRARIVEALTNLSGRHRFVVVTGGLGPTSDDLTTAAAAEALGVGLIRDAASLEAIQRRFATINRPMTPSNEKQADFPEGATILPNPIGTAAGFAMSLGRARFFFTPGVPAEMRRLYEDHIEPTIAPLVERRSHQIRLRTFGMAESAVGEKLGAIEAEEKNVTIGYRATFPEIEVKVLARGTSEAEAEATAARVAERVKLALGNIVFGEGEETYPSYVGRVLRARGMSLAIAESCTGGLVGQLVTSVPGSSEYLLFDAVTYSNASKISVLGVNEETIRGYGAVSLEVASAMADGARRIADADLSVAITGIAGPGGGTDEKPVGTVFLALARRGAPTQAHALKFGGDRERIRTFSAYHALRLVAEAASAR
jgi:nicotinamide-nucleotide amidase